MIGCLICGTEDTGRFADDAAVCRDCWTRSPLDALAATADEARAIADGEAIAAYIILAAAVEDYLGGMVVAATPIEENPSP